MSKFDSKAGLKAPQVELEKINLRPLVERVVERETAQENTEIKLNVADDLPVNAYPELLARAIGNIVRNAVRYTDSGAGVPAEALDKIFDPFYRVESHRSRATGDTGLGLAIVKTCVEACQGKVFAENLKPKGFAVTILLKN